MVARSGAAIFGRLTVFSISRANEPTSVAYKQLVLYRRRIYSYRFGHSDQDDGRGKKKVECLLSASKKVISVFESSRNRFVSEREFQGERNWNVTSRSVRTTWSPLPEIFGQGDPPFTLREREFNVTANARSLG